MPKAVSPVIPGYEDFEVKLAENQPEYQTLPVLPLNDYPHFTMVSRWEFTPEELSSILETGCIYVMTATFGVPFQPMMILTRKLEVEQSTTLIEPLKSQEEPPIVS